MDLKWEERLRNYQEAAFKRGMINTPSYSQVVKPLYTTSINRWKNYIEINNPEEKHCHDGNPRQAEPFRTSDVR